MSSDNNIKAGSSRFIDLLQLGTNGSISIPDYQRPYVWDTEKIDILIKDLKSHLKEATIQYYYLGSVLFFSNNQQYEIIDGQQRFTTYLLLDYVCNKSDSIIEKQKDNLKFFFNSPISKKHISENKTHLEQKHKEWLINNWNTLKEQLLVSVIITQNQDDAFTFFETQNNRGKKLSAVDYLKSYHLRELKDEEKKQRYFATRWDKNNNKQFLNTLYTKVLWRTRNWKGKSVEFGKQKDILSEFQKKLQKMKKGKVKIFPNIKNKIADTIHFTNNNGIQLFTSPISLEAKTIDYPFSMRQPLEKGIGFFLYTEKYNDLYKYLFYNLDNKEYLNDFKEFYKKLYIDANMSWYFVEFYRLSCIIYYDKFENNEFFKFAQYLDYLIGSYRINQSSIVERTPVKILRDNNQNLLDIISNAFEPEEVFDFIESITNDNIYTNEDIVVFNTDDKGNIHKINENRVKERYKLALLDFYNKPITEKLSNRLEWIIQ